MPVRYRAIGSGRSESPAPSSRSAAGRTAGSRSVGGIVLAGGESRRFGSDKLGAELAGRPLVLHAVGALQAVELIERVVVVGPAEPIEPDWLPAIAAVGVSVVRDEERFGGPLAGLAVGLDSVGDADIAVVTGGDMPSLDPIVLGDLIRDIATGSAVDIAFLASGGEQHPLPLALAVGPARRVARDLLGRGQRSLRAYLEAFRYRDAWTAFDERSIVDVDTPEDLARLRT